MRPHRKILNEEMSKYLKGVFYATIRAQAHTAESAEWQTAKIRAQLTA